MRNVNVILGVIVAITLTVETSKAIAADSHPCVQTSHGCIWINQDVTQETITTTICVKGYTKGVRPATTYTNGIKKRLLREQGVDVSRIHEFELDHIIPLAVGGHPRNPSNLMLQPWEGEEGAKVKDKLESRLHSYVCKGKISLEEAQHCIAENWLSCAAKYPGKGRR